MQQTHFYPLHLLFFLCAVLSGCKLEQTAQTTTTSVWTAEDQRLVVIRDNGNQAGERFTTFDYARDDLSGAALSYLNSLELQSEDLFCVEDGVTYELTITDQHGLERKYYSSNRYCNELVTEDFIAVDAIEVLVSLL